MSCHARAMFRETIVFLVASYGKIITCGLSTENPKVVNFMSAFKSLSCGMELVLTPQNTKFHSFSINCRVRYSYHLVSAKCLSFPPCLAWPFPFCCKRQYFGDIPKGPQRCLGKVSGDRKHSELARRRYSYH